ncbi:hypothetical protein ACQ4PT_058064 [Festuca glaucescens]
MAMAAGGVSTRGAMVSTVGAAALAMFVVDTVILGEPMLPGDITIRVVPVAAMDTEQAVVAKVGMSVAAPNAIPQQPTVTSQGAQDIQGAGAKGNDNEGQGLLKKKKEDKAGCFRCFPSDIRSDYLSLWGVGTLFGKTLDVDMAYTRNKKVLRTKIGCLDRNLIPADSDVFIRRGFFKLRFEVETTQGSQEVNMVEANNGNDGSDDAHHGEENNGGGNAMDMDPKGSDEGNTSNNNGQEGSFENNGVDGMQVQDNHIDEIQIGTMNVQITPTDGLLSKSTSGLPLVGSVAGSRAAGRMVLHALATAAHPVADSQLPRPIIGAQRAEHLVVRVAGSRAAGSTRQPRQSLQWPTASCHGLSLARSGQSIWAAASRRGTRRHAPCATAPGQAPRPDPLWLHRRDRRRWVWLHRRRRSGVAALLALGQPGRTAAIIWQ